MNRLKDVKKCILSVLEGGDILFVIPPFASIKSTFFGPHILQNIAHEKGFKADVLYLNILFASIIGPEFAEGIGISKFFQSWDMVGERLFARSAYGLPPLGQSPEFFNNEGMSISGEGYAHRKMDYEIDELEPGKFYKLEEVCKSFVDEVVNVIAGLDYKITGCTTRVGQTNCAIAIIDGIKRIQPEKITIIGGINCQGEMAEGIASLSDSIDYVFSGESEYSFSNFLNGYSVKQLPLERIIVGKPLMDLEKLPLMNYDNYFTQLNYFLGDQAPEETGIWYETSRGCWWGQKNKCTFCGQDDETMKFRQKSPLKALNELRVLQKLYPGSVVAMTDNMIPLSYQKRFLPGLAGKKGYPRIHFYYIKANTPLKELIKIKNAKIEKLAPGIESLSTDLLKLMNKGVTAGENVQLLRNACSLGLNLHWIMLWGFPGDTLAHYEEILKLLPLICHLQPPAMFLCLRLLRFSRYFKEPFAYGIKNLRPWAVYNMIYPGWADIDKLAYYFVGDFPSESFDHPGIIEKIFNQVGLWRKKWGKAKLIMIMFGNSYVVYDNRDPEKSRSYILEYSKAKVVMKYCSYNESEYQKWAVEKKLGVIIDSRYVPLVTASPELLSEFEENC